MTKQKNEQVKVKQKRRLDAEVAKKYIVITAGIVITLPVAAHWLQPDLAGRILGFFVISLYLCLFTYLFYVSYRFPRGVANKPILLISATLLAFALFVIVDMVLEGLEMPDRCGDWLGAGNCIGLDGFGTILYLPFLGLTVTGAIVTLFSNSKFKYSSLEDGTVKKLVTIDKAQSKQSKIVLFLCVAAIVGFAVAYAMMVLAASKPPSVTVGGTQRTMSQQLKESFSSSMDQVAQTTPMDFLARGVDDECYKDHFEAIYGCELVVTQFYGVHGDFRTTLTNLDISLQQHDWNSAEMSGTIYILSNHYAKRLQLDPTFNDVTRLPSGYYHRKGERGAEEVAIRYYPVPVPGDSIFEHRQEVGGVWREELHRDKDVRSFEEINELAIKGGYSYVIVLSQNSQYYSSP